MAISTTTTRRTRGAASRLPYRRIENSTYSADDPNDLDKEPKSRSGMGKQYHSDARDSWEPASAIDIMDNLKEYITDFDQLYDAAYKCKKGVMWKKQTKSFMLNDLENIHRMKNQLKSGTWKNGKPRQIEITYPKKRDGLSIPFKDRVYQRSINDNALYPTMTRGFVRMNCACQTGKGPRFAISHLKRMLWNIYCKHGLDFYILETDIHGYYPNMSHEVVNDLFARKLDAEVAEMTKSVLDDQYAGEIGYNPGSQMVQIAGISVPDGLDHEIKEKLHERYYIRYMDDSRILNHSREKLEEDLEVIQKDLASMGFEMNEKKTRIVHMTEGFSFLGFDFRMMETGKIIMTINSDSVRSERRKLRRMAAKIRKGELDKRAADEHLESYLEYILQGNCWKVSQRLKKYYKELLKGDGSNENLKKDPVLPAGKRIREHEG